MNYKIILNTLGWVIGLEAIFMLLPLICAFIYNEPIANTFLVSSLLSL